MARSTTSTQAAALNALHRSTHKYVLIEDAAGNMVDVTDLQGLNWLISVEVDVSADQPVGGCKITLWRNKEGLSLAPLIEGSEINQDSGSAYAPFVNPARKVEVYVAPMIAGVTPGPSDRVLLWEGYLDNPGWGGHPSRLTSYARDPVARLNDTFIEEARTYGGGSPPTPIQDVMQQILDDHFGSGAFPLTVVGDPDFGITGEDGDGYEVTNVTVLEALVALRDEIGWNLHWRWDESAGEFRLTLYEPARDVFQTSPFTPDWTFGIDDYYDVSEIGIDQAGIRNAGKLLYVDEDGVEQFVEDERSSSIGIYDRRFILLDERGSQITTQAQAENMLGAILDDLESPPALQTIEAAFHWPIDIADVHTYEANDRWYDTDQHWAVFAYRHVLTPTTTRTYITAGGKPSGGFARWHRRVSPPVPDPDDLPEVTDLSYTFNAADELVVTVRAVRAGSVRAAAASSRPSDPTIAGETPVAVDSDGLATFNFGTGFPTSVVVAAKAYENSDGSGLSGTTYVSDTFRVTHLEAEGGTIGGWELDDDEIKASAGGFSLNSSTRRLLIGAATAALTGVGIFLGHDGASGYDFRAGDPAGDYVHWDASLGQLYVSGEIEATAGTIGGWTIGASTLSSGGVTISASAERILMGAATAPLTGEGVFLGLSGGEYQARFGDPAGDYFLWNGTSIVLGGQIVETGNLVDASVTSDKINDAAVTTAKLFNASVTTDKIDAAAVTNEKLGDRAVAIQNLFVGSFDNLVPNGGFEASGSAYTGWSNYQGNGTWAVSAVAPRSGLRHVSCDPSTGTTTMHLIAHGTPNAWAVNGGDVIYAETYIRKASAVPSNAANIRVRFHDAAFNFISNPTAGGFSTDTLTTSYQKAGGRVTAPSNAAYCSVTLTVANDGNPALIYFDDVYVRRAVEGSLVVDGTLTAAKIEVGSLTGDRLASNTISASNLFVGSHDNLIWNPGFEQSASSFAPHIEQQDGGSVGFSVSSSTVRSGARCLFYNTTGQTGEARLDLNGTFNVNAAHFAATEGDQVYAEGYARCDSAGSCNRVRLRWSFRNASGTQIGSATSSYLTPTNSGYAKFSIAGTAPAGTAYAFPILLVENDGHTNNIRFDDFYARRMLEGSLVVDGTVTAAKMVTDTLTAAQIASLSFSGKSATFDTGSIGGWLMSTGTLTSGNVTIDADNERILMGSATAPLTGVGVFLGHDGGSGYDFRVGDPAGDYIHWDASTSTLEVNAENFTAPNPVFEGHVAVEGASGVRRAYLTTLSSGATGALRLYDASEFAQVGTVYLPDGIDVSTWIGDYTINAPTGDLIVTANNIVLTPDVEIEFGGNVVFDADSTYDVGTTSVRPATIYGDILDGRAIHVGAGAAGSPPSGFGRIYWDGGSNKLYVLNSSATLYEVTLTAV